VKTLQNQADKHELLRRLATIHPESTPRWGRMSALQMIAHLKDAFEMSMGLRRVSPVRVPYPRTMLRWTALWVPIPWPHGFPAAPELNQEVGGTPPREFAADVRDLAALIERFTRRPCDFEWRPHPHFGAMSERDWMRLGYLHTDHHFRQFGA
jgi:hypothetical protein